MSASASVSAAELFREDLEQLRGRARQASRPSAQSRPRRRRQRRPTDKLEREIQRLVREEIAGCKHLCRALGWSW